MRTPLLIALVVYLMAYNLKAEYLAYDWTVGEWPNEIGLQGITNWDGKTYFTKICFGGWCAMQTPRHFKWADAPICIAFHTWKFGGIHKTLNIWVTSNSFLSNRLQ